MSHDHTFIYSEEVKKYKVRPFHNQRDSDAEKLAKVAAGQALSPADESLVEKCLNVVAANFAARPHIDNFPEHQF